MYLKNVTRYKFVCFLTIPESSCQNEIATLNIYECSSRDLKYIRKTNENKRKNRQTQVHSEIPTLFFQY